MTSRQGIRGLAAVAWLALAICAICACSSGRAGPSVASLPSQSARPSTTLTQAQQFHRLVQFAECMRSHGIDVPDPQGNSFQIPVATDPATTAAMRACQQLLPSIHTSNGSGPNGSLAAEIASRIGEMAFFDLDAPVGRVCSAEVPIPYPKHLEDAALPQPDRICAAVRDLLKPTAGASA